MAVANYYGFERQSVLSEVIQEPPSLKTKPGILVKKSVVLVKRKMDLVTQKGLNLKFKALRALNLGP